jgi:hypothetical protein
MAAKKTADEFRRDSLVLARHTADLRQMAEGILARAKERQRMAVAAEARARHAYKRTEDRKRR